MPRSDTDLDFPVEQHLKAFNARQWWEQLDATLARDACLLLTTELRRSGTLMRTPGEVNGRRHHMKSAPLKSARFYLTFANALSGVVFS
jgi:hypothetical protein